MGKIGYTLIALSFCAVVVLTEYDPAWFGDENLFVKQFVNEQALNIIGVIIAIFLPSAAGLYIRLAELQKELGVDLSKYRETIRWNCVSVVVLFAVLLFLLVIKGAIEGTREFASAVNGLTIVVLLTNLLLLVDLTIGMFDVGEASATRRSRKMQAKTTGEEERHGDAKASPGREQA